MNKSCKSFCKGFFPTCAVMVFLWFSPITVFAENGTGVNGSGGDSDEALLVHDSDIVPSFSPTNLRVEYCPSRGFTETSRSPRLLPASSRIAIYASNAGGYAATWNKATKTLMVNEELGFGSVHDFQILNGVGARVTNKAFTFAIGRTNPVMTGSSKAIMAAAGWQFW